jgi:hypothetical protein
MRPGIDRKLVKERGWQEARVLHCRSGACRAINVKKVKLERLFAEELERLQPSAAYMPLVKDAIIRVWQEERAAVQQQIAESKRRVEAIQSKLDKLTEAFIFEQAIDIGVNAQRIALL